MSARLLAEVEALTSPTCILPSRHSLVIASNKHARYPAVLYTAHRCPGHRRLLPDSMLQKVRCLASLKPSVPLTRRLPTPSSFKSSSSPPSCPPRRIGNLSPHAGNAGKHTILFSGSSVFFAIHALLLIGPLGGLVSVRLAVSLNPVRPRAITVKGRKMQP